MESAKEKADYVRKNRLGGISIWSLDLDGIKEITKIIQQKISD